MLRGRAVLVGGLCTAVLSGLAFVWMSRRPRSDAGAHSTQELPLSRVGNADSPPAAIQYEPARRGHPSTIREFRGFVEDTSGVAIEGARVRWLALQAEDLEASPSWPNADWGILPRSEVTQVTSAGGAFDLDVDRPDVRRFGSVLVANHPLHRPNGLHLAPSPSEWPGTVRLVLEPAPPLEVIVLDGEGRPQRGALVHHAIRPAARSMGDPGWGERFFAETLVTDEQGRARTTSWSGHQALWAELGDLVSQPWVGGARSEVVLTLEAAFTLSGRLTLPDWSDWDPSYAGERRILVAGQDGNLWRPLARLLDVDAGEWGPLKVPLGDYRSFRIRLEGAPIVPIESVHDRPRPFDRLRVDFLAEKLAEQWFFVQDQNEQPIPGAVVEAYWEGQFGSKRVEGSIKPDGFLYLGTFPAGPISCRVSAPGYAPASLHLASQIPGAVTVTLEKGGRLLGKCVYEGKPVSDFEVVYTIGGASRSSYSKAFFGRENGDFVIDALGPGDWTVYATSPELPSCEPVPVSIGVGRDAEILLELSRGLSGGGRVVDDAGNPVAGARVQPLCSGGMEPTFPWGAPAVSAADGTFELEAFVPGTNWIVVEAEGLARAEFKAFAGSTTFLDWGDVQLLKSQALVVTLTGADGLRGCSIEDLVAYTAEGHILPKQNFDSSGRVRFEGVPPGDLRLIVSAPDGAFSRFDLRLDPGSEWRFEHRIAGGRCLDVRVLDAEGKPLADRPNVYVTAQEGPAFVLRWSPTNAEGRSSFQGLGAEQVHVLVLDSANSPLATRETLLGRAERLEVEIRVGQEPVRVKVIDGEGTPLAGAWVTMISAGRMEVLALDDTDADGWAELFVDDVGAVVLDIRHGLAGLRQGVPIDVGTREHTVVLLARGALAIRIFDGELPLPGVSTRLETGRGTPLGQSRGTDEAGVVKYAPLGEGSYHLSCTRADCWPVTLDHQLSADEHAVRDVQMRRLADVVVTVVNRDGLPVSGLELVLRSAEFGDPVASWIEAGKVESSTGTTTDVRGQIRAKGLPRGEYVWSLPGADPRLEGAFELTPGIANEVTLLLPHH